jgi:uncharacterized protein
MEMIEKIQKLEGVVSSYGRVIVGFSGGVDSSLVSFVASRVLGDEALIILARTETIIDEDIELARNLARRYSYNYREISYNELEIENYASNPINRCYFCKNELYTRLKEIAREEGIPVILDGANLDDLGDYRPGRIAAGELQVRSPLIDAGFTKSDVREVARYYGLSNHDKPAAPCLSSRIPYGTSIDRESLTRIAEAEKFIRSLGFTNVRVRHFGAKARIEVDRSDVGRLLALHDEMTAALNKLGYLEVEIDREGFKSGKLNVTQRNTDNCTEEHR